MFSDFLECLLLCSQPADSLPTNDVINLERILFVNLCQKSFCHYFIYLDYFRSFKLISLILFFVLFLLVILNYLRYLKIFITSIRPTVELVCKHGAYAEKILIKYT